jgi:hypothetical protein
MILDGVPIPGAITEDGVTEAGVDARDAMWQHLDLLPDWEDLDGPVASIDRVIGGDTSGIEVSATNTRPLPRHVGEARQVQLVGDGNRLGRAVTVLGQNEIRFPTARVVTLEGVRAVQQNDHVGVLLQRA